MPSAQVIDLNPSPRTEETSLEKTLGAFANRHTENRREKEETDALRSIYDQHLQDGRKLEDTLFDIQTRPGISPTTRVNSAKQLLEMSKYNSELTNKAKEAMIKKESNQKIISDLETRYALEPGALAAYENDPKMAEKVARPPKEGKENISEKPINEDQLRRIQHVRSQPEFKDMDEVERYEAFTNSGVSGPNAEREAKLHGAKLERQEKAVDSAYKAQEKFINDTTSSYKAFESDTKPKVLQMQKVASDEQLISPTAASFLETLGIPLGALDNPDSELYQKLSLDLLKGLPETYGNRILKVEVDNFLKTVPGLLNSPDGRRMIASNLLKLGEMKEVYYNEMRKTQREYLDSNKPLPRDFQQKVFDQVKPQIDRINSEFVKLSEIKSVPRGTIPFFGPDGEVAFVPKENAQWAEQNGGKRIW